DGNRSCIEHPSIHVSDQKSAPIRRELRQVVQHHEVFWFPNTPVDSTLANQAAEARGSVRLSQRRRGIWTISTRTADPWKCARVRRCPRTAARASAKVASPLAYQAACRRG